MKASLFNYQQAPRKVRLLAGLIRGKKTAEAISILAFTDKRASLPIQKLINSAVANALVNFNVAKEDLIISEISVNKGRVLKRSMPRARGSAFTIRLRSSHVEVVLDKLKGNDKEPLKVIKDKTPQPVVVVKEIKSGTKSKTVRTKKNKAK